MAKSLLIIFVRNPERGKVKTRLAATIGLDKALEVYLLLLQRTMDITQPLLVDKTVFFSDFLERNGKWGNQHYQHQVQQGGDLGERMAQAFAGAFAKGYKRVGIIGSDCYELTSGILGQAFDLLEEKDLVLGPSTDGGYYFLGMTRFWPEIFQHKTWSAATVLAETLADAARLQLKCALLAELTDVDEAKDLVTIPGFKAGGRSRSGK
jgi:rSAM/selenodomain-associated transferase 1